MAFATEREMVQSIIKSTYIDELTASSQSIVKEEVSGFFGIPDIVVATDNAGKQLSYAYEAKLKNWKKAIFQAFRYKAFADFSYVIMDHDHVKPALSQLEKFKRSNIGLLSINDSGELITHYAPFQEVPYSPLTASRFNKMIIKEIYNQNQKMVQCKITDIFFMNRST
jgi:hypothetical protein